MADDFGRDAAALFSVQLLFHTMRNLVSLGVLPIDVALKNVEEATQHLSKSHPSQSQDFAALEKGFQNGLRAAETLRRGEGGAAPDATLFPPPRPDPID